MADGGGKISVLVVDDSALIRRLLPELLSEARDIEVVGVAADPYDAREKIRRLNPDVVTLDIEMPRMDGLSFLEKIMTLRPMPVLMVSSLTASGADATLRALELGAVDYVEKPKLDVSRGLSQQSQELIAKVRSVAAARVRPISKQAGQPAAISRSARKPADFERGSDAIVAIGASTGGVECLRELLGAFPADGPPIVIAQHMPEQFTATFANRLDKCCAIAVVEAASGSRILPGHAYIAPGNLHLRVTRSGANFICRLDSDPPVSGHRPSVDVLFESVAAAAREKAIGVILTGMGRDGATGLGKMRAAGAYTIGQDESTCVVYGMPKAAMTEGAVVTELPLNRIPDSILRNYAKRAETRLG